MQILSERHLIESQHIQSWKGLMNLIYLLRIDSKPPSDFLSVAHSRPLSALGVFSHHCCHVRELSLTLGWIRKSVTSGKKKYIVFHSSHHYFHNKLPKKKGAKKTTKRRFKILKCHILKDRMLSIPSEEVNCESL